MSYSLEQFVWLTPLIILDLILRSMALWKAARANQRNWFIALFFINSLGILPAVYLYLKRSK